MFLTSERSTPTVAHYGHCTHCQRKHWSQHGEWQLKLLTECIYRWWNGIQTADREVKGLTLRSLQKPAPIISSRGLVSGVCEEQHCESHCCWPLPDRGSWKHKHTNTHTSSYHSSFISLHRPDGSGTSAFKTLGRKIKTCSQVQSKSVQIFCTLQRDVCMCINTQFHWRAGRDWFVCQTAW